MNPVVHFEMPTEDRKRIADFYTRVFGWRMQMLGPEMGNYVVVTTTEPDEKGRPKKPGAINGGFFQKSDDKPSQYPGVVIAVEDIKEHAKKVAAAGGTAGAVLNAANEAAVSSFLARASLISSFKPSALG